ncbi:arginine--tRNA ligase [Candidatus Gracilibacteria bacterium GN02-872]|nr:arginine--tRNA ligase [Candidatus Gracilibacteria bacterium GN02-872]
MKTKLQEILKKIIKELYSIENSEIILENPPKKDLGDFAFGPFLLAKELKKSPIEIGKEIIEELKKYPEITDVSQAGPYINIKLDKSIFTEIFLQDYKYFSEKDVFTDGEGKIIFIDYIGPNVGKPLHIGHMCTPNIGQAMIGIYKKLGFRVISDSHIGDWGIIFGKLIMAFKLWGDEKKLQEDAINHLLELYIKITNEIEKQGENSELEEQTRQEFKKLSTGNKDSIELWKKFTNYSIIELRKQLKNLNVEPDYNIGESFYEGLGLPKLEDYPDLKYSMKDIVSELVEKKVATKNSDNSVGVEFAENLKIPSCVLAKRDGSHGYLASDLAAIKYRIQNWNPYKIIYFVDVRQSLHFRQAFEIAKNAGWLGQIQLIHAPNGFISLKEGAMSTRKGKIIKLEDLLNESKNRARKIILEKRQDFSEEELENLSRIIGIGAIKYGYLKKSRENNVVFDWDEFMTFEGNSGPYIQYSYVRAKKILSKVGEKLDLKNIGRFDFDEEIALVKLLSDYKNILQETAEKNMPHVLCAYVFELTKAFNSLYNSVNILGEEDFGKKNLRILLVDLFAKILKDCFDILAIEMPEEM